MEMEDAVLEENGNVGAEVDPLNKFLPPAPKSKCSEELQVSCYLRHLLIIVL